MFGAETFQVEVALGEVVMNALRYSHNILVKINKIGDEGIIWVDDNGPSFAGNEAIAKIRAAGIAETFCERLDSDRGRGIAIMLSLMDKVCYNRRGNKVLLVKKLR